MKKQIFLSLLVISLLSVTAMLIPNLSFADSTTLKISPSVIRIQTKPPADIWAPFIVENKSNQPNSLKIGYKTIDPQASSNGKVTFLQDSQQIPGVDQKIFEKMQIVDDQNISHETIDIAPQQKLRFRLHIILPQNEPTSDYYFSLIFLQSQLPIDQNITNNIEARKSFSTLQTGIGINVLLAVGEKEAPQVSIEKFSAPWFVNNGPVHLRLTLHNSGTHFINPHGEILIKNTFGQTIGKIKIPETLILSGTSRDITTSSLQYSNNSNAESNNGISSDQGLLWPERFLLGIYTATFTLTLSENGPVYIRSIQFIAFPLIILLEIVIIILVLLYIYLRVKRKMA